MVAVDAGIGPVVLAAMGIPEVVGVKPDAFAMDPPPERLIRLGSLSNRNRQVPLLELGGVHEGFAVAFMDQAPHVEHIDTLGQLAHEVEILFSQQNSDAVLV